MSDTFQSLRIQNGLTQQQVAEKLHVTVPTVSSWENDKSAPRPRYVPLLAKIYGVEPRTIFLLSNTTKLNKKPKIKSN